MKNMNLFIKFCFALHLCVCFILQASAQRAKQKAVIQSASSGQKDRAYWSETLYKMVSPVIFNLAAGTLKKNMPVEKVPNYALKAEMVVYLEAAGRTMAGVAPWLALPDDDSPEGQQRKKLRLALLKGIANAVDPSNPDYLNFKTEQQPIVDAAFMAQAFLRAPKALWEPLDSVTKKRTITEFRRLRDRSPSYNNWLLFSAITEGFLLSIGEQADLARIDFALKKAPLKISVIPLLKMGAARVGESERKARAEGMPILINNCLSKTYLLYMLKPVKLQHVFKLNKIL